MEQKTPWDSSNLLEGHAALDGGRRRSCRPGGETETPSTRSAAVFLRDELLCGDRFLYGFDMLLYGFLTWFLRWFCDVVCGLNMVFGMLY